MLLHANLMIGKETCSEKQVKICYVIVLYISVVWSPEFWVSNSDNQLCVAALSLKMLLVQSVPRSEEAASLIISPEICPSPLFIAGPGSLPRSTPGTDHLTRARAHCAVSVLWRCHPGSDGLFTTITHAASLPELSTNNWAAKYFSRACWEMKCCKEMHLNRCVAGKAAIIKRAFLEHLHLHSKQSYLP